MAVTRGTAEDLDTTAYGSQTQRMTQEVVDPRRMGNNNSGLEEVDIADVLCILHPCSPAAFNIVASTATRSPQHVLQNVTESTYADGLSPSELEEQETFILDEGEQPNAALDLALRFSARTVNPAMGFVFGRNPNLCDVVVDTDTVKRVSNRHFRIYVNPSGVCMLQDLSTNGTVVDDVVLKGKEKPEDSTRMLNGGSIIQILSPKASEVIKFILRIPSRESHLQEFAERFNSYMREVAIAQARQGFPVVQHRGNRDAYPRLAAAGDLPICRPPLVQNAWGMHWNGGDRYNVVGHLGKGAFATVYRLATKSDGQLFAAKELEKRRFMKNGILDRKLGNELQIMRGINHTHVVQYVDYQDVENHLYIIMEYVPCGDLNQWLGTRGALPEELTKIVAIQIFDALAYLHRKMITHRDIKPDNILIADDSPQRFTVKLSDFGLSKVVTDNDTFLKTFCGTLLYCAPEVFPQHDAYLASKGKKRSRSGTTPQKQRKYHSYSQSVDIWSFGAVLWFSMCLRPPFEGVADATGRGMFERIIATSLDPTPLRRRGISQSAIDLLNQMLNTDPSIRPTPQLCLLSEWLDGGELAAIHEQTQLGLVTIDEEEEVEGAADLSQLSINEDRWNESQPDFDMGSSDLDFLDPRQSKRFKVGPASPARNVASTLHRVLTKSRTTAPLPVPQTPNRNAQSIGAVEPSLLASSGVFGIGFVARGSPTQSEGDPVLNGTNQDAQSRSLASTASHQQQTAASQIESQSLEGAESHLRDLNMDSPQSADSPQNHGNEPQTPTTPDNAEAAAGQIDGTAEETPRPRQLTPKERLFNRQINLPIPASFFYDPDDPSTHTPEYASAVSGHDFNGDGLLPAAGFHSLPAALRLAVSHASPQTEFVRPAPRLGRLTTTINSFAAINLTLSARVSTWGRAPNNDFVYPDPSDVRIPKRGIMLYFHAVGIEKADKAGEDWTKLPGLHCLIATESRSGIWINGVKLTAKTAEGRQPYGRIYTGDEITVCPGHSVLRFTCQFNHGEGKDTRPADAPKFKVLVSDTNDD